MTENMTRTSAYMFENATSGRLTVREAASWLNREAQLRSLRDKLERFAKGRELRPLLVNGLAANNPEQSREAIERKVRGWLNDPARTIRKRDAIQLCFILGLSVREADDFLAMVSEEAFHWRDPEEIVYIYALDHGMDYSAARKLDEEIRGRLKKRRREDMQIAEDSFTPVIREELERLDSVEELTEYIEEAQNRLGSFHNSAYQLFMDLWSLLEEAAIEDGLPDSKSFTAKYIVEKYLNKRFIPRFRKAGNAAEKENEEIVYSAVQRGIWQGWPEEVAISRMKNREADISRKALILLFLVTDGGDGEYEDESLQEQSPEEIFASMHLRMDTMLKHCGFARLDPRVPFDWIILYCMSVQDIFQIDRKMKLFLREVFRTGGE